MRVLVFTSVFPNGKDPLFGIFVKERIQRVRSDCEVVVVAPVAWFPFNRFFRGPNRSGIPAYESQDGLSVYHPKFFSIPGIGKCLDGVFCFLFVFPLVCRLRRSFRFDLIDAHFVYPDGLAACLLAKTFACPVTITLRGTIGKLARFFLRRKQIQWALAAASKVFCVSGSLRDIALELGCNPRKLHVVPNGIDGAVFHPINQTEARRNLGLAMDRTIVLSVGALSLRKGHQRVLEILPAIVEKYPNLLFVVVGGPGAEGDTGPLLRAQLSKLRLEKHVHLAGPRPHNEIALWLGAADLFCLATSNEGMANVLVEALACGVPVVTTRVGGNAELIEEGKNGLLVPPDDPNALKQAILEALARMWDRKDIAQRMQGRTWDVTAEAVISQWQAVADGRGIISRSVSAAV